MAATKLSKKKALDGTRAGDGQAGQLVTNSIAKNELYYNLASERANQAISELQKAQKKTEYLIEELQSLVDWLGENHG